MRKYLCIFGVVLVLGSCAKPRNEEERVLEAAKGASAAACQKTNGSGCKFSTSRTKDGWAVHVEHIILSESGERVHLPGAFHVHHFDKEGNLVSTSPGF
jgi:hypothetical protein